MATTADPIEEMKATERRFVEGAWNRGDLSSLDETHGENLVVHWNRDFTNLFELREFIAEVREAFPDFHIHTEFEIAEDDTVTVGFTATGTHERPFRGVPATGRRVRFSGTWTHRFEDGRIVEGWTAWDDAEIARQLGVDFPRVLVTLPMLYGRRLVAAIRSR
jgi:steroid delta-isomerase-like uncharacterized protein